MNRNRILIALIALGVIVAIVLLRDQLARVFAPSQEQQELADYQKEYQAAEAKLSDAEKSIERTEVDLESQKDALNKAQADRNAAYEKLQEFGQSNAEIETLVQEESAPLLRVEVQSLQAEQIASGIALSGEAEAARKLEVRAETSGQVISEPISSGTSVKQGDILCELEPGSRQAALDQANAALATAVTQYESTRSLKNRGLASTAALQNANANLEQAQSAVDNAEREISRLTITAPFDGVLENQTAELGTLLQPGSPCASIIALDRLVLVGYAAETQVDKIRMNAPARGILRDGNELDGVVTFVAATADPQTRTFRTEVSVTNSGKVRDGASVRIEIALAGVMGHLIPQNALTLNNEGVLGVKINENGVARFVEVEMVRDTPEGIWVTGLTDQVEIIIQGQEYAVDGQEIDPVPTDNVAAQSESEPKEATSDKVKS